jgi:hypothetical protein
MVLANDMRTFGATSALLDIRAELADNRDFLREISDGAVKLVVTSPPYTIGKAYERRKSLEACVSEQTEVIRECTRVRTPKTNGFVERFNGILLDEFFRVALRDNLYDSVEALQADLDAWLVHYNTERPHLGYRNMG